ncbi:MAG: hypothetical protein AAGF12_23270 [Myxococcota bacterium]
MTHEKDSSAPAGGDPRLHGRPCPKCGRHMRFTGLPDVAGPVYERIYQCREHGYVRLKVTGETPEGWG